MKATALTIFVTPVKGEEIRIEKACTLKQAVTLAKKEARKMINNGGMFVTINVIGLDAYGLTETLAHIEAEKEGRRVKFSDEAAAETYAVCWGDEYKEEAGESNVIAETADESEAKEIALNESRVNGCTMSVVRMSDKAPMLVISDSIGLTSEAAAAYNALCSSYVDTYQPEPTNPDNTPSAMNANEIRESISRLRYELQDYRNNASKGGANRQRNMAMLVEDIARLEATANKKGPIKVKTMQDLENQACRLSQRTWNHFNGWSSVNGTETIKALRESRDALINSAYLNAAAKHLTEKAKAINGFLNVLPIHEAFCVALEYSSPSVGMALKIASPFCVESFLTNPDQVLEKLNA